MKTIIRLWNKFYSSELFYVFAHLATVGWYGYAIRIIANADLPLVISILMYLGGLFFGFFTIASLLNHIMRK